ncbi:hypothetical protein PG994_005660 [Apiospora phragmitis]|uniref:CST complex subunit Stn1 N-terminal domain-containing protein n=1 Tax=Apiospora phragmitis TaxID=2905665 RepID=A0ABR1VCV5_9PEZI
MTSATDQKYIFFHLNHPIYWVRIVGVVVAIDSFYSRRIYTIDDSSGTCIECCVTVPAPDKNTEPTTTTTSKNNNNNALLPPPPPDPYPGIETGLVVDIKGYLTVFRNAPQIAVAKMAHLRSTGAEVAFWGKVRAFRQDPLGSPWVVDASTARRLKRANEKDVVGKQRREEQKKREQRQRQQQLVGGRSGGERRTVDNKKGSSTAAHDDEERRKRSRRDEGATTDQAKDSRRQRREGERRNSRRKAESDDAEQKKAIPVSLRHKPHRPSKLSEVATYTEGQYDALGL